MTESEARYIQRLPEQMERALRRVAHYQAAYTRYDMQLETEAQELLQAIYGTANPGLVAEREYRRANGEGEA